MAELNMDKPYKAVVVCLVPDDGILFAKRADSQAEASQIVFDDMLRIMDDYECKLEVSNFRDSYGEWCTEVKCEVGTYMYKVCFDDEERTKAVKINVQRRNRRSKQMDGRRRTAI